MCRGIRPHSAPDLLLRPALLPLLPLRLLVFGVACLLGSWRPIQLDISPLGLAPLLPLAISPPTLLPLPWGRPILSISGWQRLICWHRVEGPPGLHWHPLID